MASISSLFVELKLSAESFNNGLKEAQREAKEFEKSLKPTLTVVKDLGIAMGAAGAAIVAGMGAAAKSAVDYGDKLNDARLRTGATVETLAKLGFAAEQSGSSFEGLSTGLRFLARNMETAIEKGGEQRKAFNDLGITSKELAGAQGDVNKVFLLLADRFKELPEGTERSTAALRIFGKSGADLIPLLLEGSAGIRKLGDDAQKAGLVISQDFASASDKLNDTLNEVKASALGASIGIAEALLPALQDAASFAADAGRQFAAFAKEHPGLVQAVGALGIALVGLGGTLTSIAVLVPKLQLGYQLLSAAIAGPGGLVVAIGAAVIAIGSIVYVSKLWYDAEQNLKKQTDELTASQERAAKSLQEHGIQIRLDQIPVERRTEALASLGEQLRLQTAFVGPLIDKTELLTRASVNEAAAEKARERALKDVAAAQDLASKAFRIALDMRVHDADLLPKLTRLQFDFNDALKEGADAAIRAARDLGDFNSVVDEAVASMDQASYNATQMQKDFDSLSKADPGVHIAAGIEEADKATVKLKSSFDDVKRTASNVFQEMFRDGEISFTKLGGVLRGVFETAASQILATMTAKLITPLVDKITGALSSLLGGIPGLGGIFGGAASAAGGAASAGGGAASSASSLASGATGILGGVIGGGIAAAGSLLGSARLEGTMNAVEFNTRATYIELRDTMDLILQPMKARLEDILAELYNHKYIPDILETIANRIGGAPSGVGTVSTQGGTSISINVFQNAGEDGAGFARRIAEELNRYVQFGGGRLIASGLNA